MPRPHIPTPLEELGNRPFSFYPAIWNVEHNEWRLRGFDWDEIQVINTKSLEEVWIPRGFVSGVSSIEEPIVIVGLRKELEYREGALVPRIQRVIEMPRAVNDVPRWSFAEPEPGRLAPVVGIRVESNSTPAVSRKWIAKVAAGVLTCIMGLVILRDGTSLARGRLFAGSSRIAMPFKANDDYISIVNKLGHPVDSRTRIASNGREFLLLRYPDRGFTVVLAGGDRDSGRYIGALGRGGRILHSVMLPSGQDSTALLGDLRPNRFW